MTSNHDNKLSLSELKSQAEQGDMQAQFALGLYYLPTEITEEGWEFKGKLFDDYFLASIDGLVIDPKIFSAFEAAENNREVNDELAFMWFEKAAKQGHMESQYALARCYFEGRGVEQRDKSAFEWVEKSSMQGFSEAHCLLGDLYRDGRGVEANDTKALDYYKCAIDGGVSSAYPKRIKIIMANGIIDYDGAKDEAEDFVKKIIQHIDDQIETCEKHRFYGQHISCIGRNEIVVPEDDEDSFEFEEALERIRKITKWQNQVITEQAKVIKDQAQEIKKQDQEKKELILTIKRYEREIEEKNKALHEKEKEMLSFFTHTMRNALATAPESLRQAIRLLGSEDYEKNQKHYEAINEITSLFSTLSLTDCLIDTFKQSIYDTEEFKRAWQKDTTGDATIQWVIAAAIRQSLNRIIFMSNTRNLIKLLQDDPTLIKPTRKAFIDQVLPLDIDEQGVESFYVWIKSLSAIKVSIEENNVQFGINQIKFSLLFSITSELILNALKYWNGEGQIQIRWYTEHDYYIFTVKNACRKNASSNLAGTHKGLAFIERLMELLDDKVKKTYSHAQFKCYPEEHTFTAELKLHKTLLGNYS